MKILKIKEICSGCFDLHCRVRFRKCWPMFTACVGDITAKCGGSGSKVSIYSASGVHCIFHCYHFDQSILTFGIKLNLVYGEWIYDKFTTLILNLVLMLRHSVHWLLHWTQQYNHPKFDHRFNVTTVVCKTLPGWRSNLRWDQRWQILLLYRWRSRLVLRTVF